MEGRLNECSAKFAAFMYPVVRNNALYARSCGTHIYANTWKNYIFFYALISFPGYWWFHETLKRIHQAYSPWSIYSLLIGGWFKVHCLWVWATLVVCRKYSTYGGEKGKKIETTWGFLKTKNPVRAVTAPLRVLRPSVRLSKMAVSSGASCWLGSLPASTRAQ